MMDALGFAALAATQFGLRASTDQLPSAMTVELVGSGRGFVYVQHYARIGEHLFAGAATVDGAGRWSL